jgi:hypothetical protein
MSREEPITEERGIPNSTVLSLPLLASLPSVSLNCNLILIFALILIKTSQIFTAGVSSVRDKAVIEDPR